MGTRPLARHVLAGCCGLASLLSGCSGGSSSKAGGAVPARVQVVPGSVLLAGAGQSRTLSASAVDAQGLPVATTFTWSSSAPDQVSVDSAGKITALKIGSALVYASAGGVASPPVLVLAADPVPGALLVSDAQVVSVGDFVGLNPGDAPDVGTQYQVQLRGVSPVPAAGTAVLAAEQASIAGQVVSASASGDLLTLTLQVVPLPSILSNFSINWNIDLATLPWALDTSAPPAPATSAASPGIVPRLLGGGLPFDEFKQFSCSAGLSPDLYSVSPSLTPVAHGNLIVTDSAENELQSGELRIELIGDLSLQGSVKIEVLAGLSGSASCRIQSKVDIPITGALSKLFHPAIKYGVGLDLNAGVEVVSGELDLTGGVGLDFDEGFSCPTDGDCSVINSISPSGAVEPSLRIPSVHDMKLTLSGFLYGFASIDALIGPTEIDAELLIFQAGPKQSADLGFEDDQAQRQDYASHYELVVLEKLSKGSSVSKILKLLTGNGNASASVAQPPGVAGPSPRAVQPAAKSPTGTFTVDKTQVAINQKVNLEVDLDPSTVDYSLFGYNVDAVKFYRLKDGGLEYEELKTVSPTVPEQTKFVYQWIPTEEDMTKNILAAFVVTQLEVGIGPALEIATNTQREVDVYCFTPPTTAALAGGAAPSSCQDTWTGQSSSTIGGFMDIQANVTWAVDVGGTLPGSGVVLYYPAGTVTVTGVTGADGCQITFTPSTFVISPATTAGVHTNGGGLTVDNTQTPPAYNGQGLTQWEATITKRCPDGSVSTTPPLPTGGTWFAGQGSVSADGLTIADTQTVPQLDQTFTYSFSRKQVAATGGETGVPGARAQAAAP